MSVELDYRSMWADGRNMQPHHSHIHTQCFSWKLPNALTLPFISSLPSYEVAQQQKAPLSQAWQSAIFNPPRMIIEFALIPFQRRLPSNAFITTLVTSDPAPVPHACAFQFSAIGIGRLRVFWMVWHSSIRSLLGLTWYRLKYPRVRVWLSIFSAYKHSWAGKISLFIWPKGGNYISKLL